MFSKQLYSATSAFIHSCARQAENLAIQHMAALTSGSATAEHTQDTRKHPSISSMRSANDRMNLLRCLDKPMQDQFFKLLRTALLPSDDEVTASRPAINTRTRRYEAEAAFAIELSLASPEVAKEMRRAARKGLVRLRDGRKLRRRLEKNMPSITAFRTVCQGNDRFHREEAAAAARGKPDVTRSRKLRMQGQKTMDHLFSAMAPGNRRLQRWLERHSLEIVPTSGHSSNCALESLLKLASGNHDGNFAQLSSSIKRELVALYPEEVANEDAMLYASPESPAFQYALDQINSIFKTNMEVFVVQAATNGLPVFTEAFPDKHAIDRRIAAGRSVPVLLFNSGAHFEPIVAARPRPAAV